MIIMMHIRDDAHRHGHQPEAVAAEPISDLHSNPIQIKNVSIIILKRIIIINKIAVAAEAIPNLHSNQSQQKLSVK